jgi:hypothetical protein
LLFSHALKYSPNIYLHLSPVVGRLITGLPGPSLESDSPVACRQQQQSNINGGLSSWFIQTDYTML